MTKKEFKILERDVKDFEKQMKSASFGKMSKYSQRLVKDQYAEATAKLMGAVIEMINKPS